MLEATNKEFLQTHAKSQHKTGRPRTIYAKKLADAYGIATRTVYQYLDIKKLPEVGQKMIGKGSIDFSVALEVLRIKDDSHTQIALLKEAKENGYSFRQMRDRVKQVLLGPPKSHSYEKLTGHLVNCACCGETLRFGDTESRRLCHDCLSEMETKRLSGEMSKEKWLKVNKKELASARRLLKSWGVPEDEIEEAIDLTYENGTHPLLEALKFDIPQKRARYRLKAVGLTKKQIDEALKFGLEKRIWPDEAALLYVNGIPRKTMRKLSNIAKNFGYVSDDYWEKMVELRRDELVA